MNKELQKIKSGPLNYAKTASIEKLTEILNHCYETYEKGTHDPIISDDNYDLMMDILEERDPNSEFIKRTKSTNNEKYAMPSLNKIRSHVESEFKKWYPGNDKEYQVSDKLDGISAKLVIDKKGVPVLTTKGRDTTPVDITNKMCLINFGTDVSLLKNVILRGEIIIPKKFIDVFVNENSETKTYKHDRAAIAGVMNNKKVLHEYQGMIDFVVYFRYNVDYDTYQEMFDDISSMGFKTPWNTIMTKLSNKTCTEILKKRRIESDYTIDGIVIAQNIKVKIPTIDNPKDTVAFKDISETAQSKVIDITWSIGQYGCLSPVLIIEPIKMNNSTINNVTAHNAKYLFDKKIGIGSIIEISHEITPQVQNVITEADPKMPEQDYVWNSTKTNIFCKDQTDEQIISEVKHFFEAINVKFLSDGVITTLNQEGYVTIMDIINADKTKLYKIKGLGKVIIDKIYNGMELALKNAALETFMAGSCFFGRNLGQRKLKLIVDGIPNVMNQDKNFLKSEILKIKGFSKISTDMFIDNFDKFKIFLEDLTSTGKIKNYFEIQELQEKKEVTEHPLNGIKLVFTNIRPKQDVKDNITLYGGSIMTSVSKNTNIVIYPNSKPESSSITKAKTLGVKLMEMDDFLKEFGL